jgi:hypothetical protein
MKFIPILFLLFYASVFLFGLMFFVRVVFGPFSPKIIGQMRKHPIMHVVWGLFAICSFYFLFVLAPSGSPAWMDRIDQRKKLAERVQSAGGWDAVRRDCEMLASNKTEPFEWYPPWTNAQVTTFLNGAEIHYSTNIDYGPLTPAVATLKPREIRYYSGVMRIRLFGMHSTGGHSSPYFGLEIVCGTNNDGYHPHQGDSGGVDGNSHSTYRKVAEGIFEIY